MSHAPSHPSPSRRNGPRGIVIAPQAGILLPILAARTDVPRIVAMPLIVDLLQPQRQKPTPEKPVTGRISIHADEVVFSGSGAVDRSSRQAKFRDAATQDPNAAIHTKADRATRCESAETMNTAHRAVLAKIGFLAPPGKHADQSFFKPTSSQPADSGCRAAAS